jgi:hypothetical protein
MSRCACSWHLAEKGLVREQIVCGIQLTRMQWTEALLLGRFRKLGSLRGREAR